MVLPLGDLQRTRIVPVVTYILIALNVTVFLVQQERGEEFTRAFAMTPWEVTHNEDLERPGAATRPGPGARPVRRRPLGDPPGGPSSITPARSRSDGRC